MKTVRIMGTAVDQVIPGLFISGADFASDLPLLQQHGITHILQVEYCIEPVFPQHFTYLSISVSDEYRENIMEHFPITFDFIDGCLKAGGRVLVHCMAGISRSATVVCAYLMKSQHIGVRQALTIVRNARHCVRPNPGFYNQLQIYHDIGFQLDTKHMAYRRFLMNQMTNLREENGYVEDMILGADPENSVIQQTTPVHNLRCRKCRRKLATQDNIVDHEAGKGQWAFAYHRRDDISNTSQSMCSSYFIEPMEWMHGLKEGRLEGKILCPKCEAKLGNYNWAGMQCSCGAWITPSFNIHKSCVDAILLGAKTQLASQNQQDMPLTIMHHSLSSKSLDLGSNTKN